MATLNQIAARVANMLNQPDNHDLKERAKDMVKTVVANRIRQSIERHGIDNILKLSFIAPVEECKMKDILDSQEHIVDNNKYIATINKIPMPVRIHNDAPFTYVGSLDGKGYTYANSMADSKRPLSSFSTGWCVKYILLNNKIVMVEQENGIVTINKNKISQILITGIWENPEDIISMFSDNDGQDVEIPLPYDVLEGVLLEVLKVEFNMYPQDISIKLNNNNKQ